MVKQPCAQRERSQSRRPFVSAARKLLDNLSELGIRARQWTDYKWNMEYSEGPSELCAFIPRAGTRPLGMGLLRPAWVVLNRLRTGVGRFQSSMHKWGLAPTSSCDCGALDQTAAHIILDCPLHRAPKGLRRLALLDDDTRCWLDNITVSI